MEPAFVGTLDTELTLRSVDERIKQATVPIVKRVEELCALLASRTEKESAGNSKASGWRRDREFSSPSHNRYDSARDLYYPQKHEISSYFGKTLKTLQSPNNQT